MKDEGRRTRDEKDIVFLPSEAIVYHLSSIVLRRRLVWIGE